MKSHMFHIHKLDDIFLLLNFFSSQGEKWIFRGQSDASWSLKSSLEREFERFSVFDAEKKVQAEQHILEMGTRVLSQEHVFSVQEGDLLETLSFVQHFGGTTRLLDFTDSFAVALFFAVEKYNEQKDASVWCIKRNALRCQIPCLRNRVERRKFADKVFKQEIDHPMVIAFAPFNLNQRIYAQQGLFLMPCSFRFSLEQQLKQMLDTTFSAKDITEANFNLLNEFEYYADRDILLKIDIGKNILQDVLIALRKMNISASTLFPDITGICRDLSLLASGYRI